MGYELFNEMFGPFEQISRDTGSAAGCYFEVLVGGFEEVYVSTSSSDSSSDMPLE